jgi:hypothetical protein
MLCAPAIMALAPIQAQAQAALPEAKGEAPETPQPLQWQLSKEFAIDESAIEASVPSKKARDRNPLEYGYFVQDLLEGAAGAYKRGDDYVVVAYYRALVKAVPERAKSWGKLCEAYATVNDHERAAKTCGTALSLPGVELQDYLRFIRETLRIPGKLSPETSGRLKDVLEHLDKQPNIEATTAHLRCEVAVALSDAKMLEACTAALTRLEPNKTQTVVYQWTLAMMRGQNEAAGRLLERAKKMKLPSENIERMQALTGGDSRRWMWTGVAAVLFMLAAVGALVVARRRRGGQLASAAR